MKTFVCILLLASVASAEDWTARLSPRMREAFQPMARDNWKPQQAAELSDKERREWTALWAKLQQAPVVNEPRPQSGRKVSPGEKH